MLINVHWLIMYIITNWAKPAKDQTPTAYNLKELGSMKSLHSNLVTTSSRMYNRTVTNIYSIAKPAIFTRNSIKMIAYREVRTIWISDQPVFPVRWQKRRAWVLRGLLMWKPIQCIGAPYLAFTYSFSIAANITLRRSTRFESMFLEILFWCFVLFSQAIPNSTFTKQPFDLSSIWYRTWSWKQTKQVI